MYKYWQVILSLRPLELLCNITLYQTNANLNPHASKLQLLNSYLKFVPLLGMHI